MPSPVLDKLDSHLQALVGARNLRRAAKRQSLVLGEGGRVLVDVYVRGRVALVAGRLRAVGMRVGATSDRGALTVVEGLLPVRAARRAAALGRVKAVLTVPPPVLSTGAVTSQGDAAHHGPQARAQGPTGTGVDVGIISDSINQVGGGVAASQATGDLPTDVTVLSDGSGGTDEGRAMAEIVYDTAPGIPRILFESVSGVGAVEKAARIDSLVAAGADVIADDTSFLSEPFFQDGVVGQAVDRARAAGTVYFTAAGNQARQSWEGTFNPSVTAGPSGNHGPLNDFDAGAGNDVIQSVVNVPSGATITIDLQWDEGFGHAATDLDLYLTDLSGTIIGSPGISDNIASGIPFEHATFTNGGANTVAVGLAIERFAGARAPFMKYIANGDFGPFSIAQFPTNSDAIVPDAATSRGSITVGAVPSDDAGLNDGEPFSSRGPKTILFDSAGNRLATPEVRQKPEIAATDNVSTTVPGFDPFLGTSAAAPSAAGVAALIRSARPSLGPDAVKAIMTDSRTTNDCNPVGEPDFVCGFGLVFADSSVLAARDTTPPLVTAQLSPPTPNGLNGFYTSDVRLTWALTDPDSPLLGDSGCGPAVLNTDTAGTTVACSATSVGGPTTGSVRLMRDASPPSVPTFTGIAARTYEQAFLPPESSTGCLATDTVSGVASSCAVSGYSRALGPHTLLGTIRNNAGLTAVASLRYTVIPTKPAISRLRAVRALARKRLLRSGLLAHVNVTRGGTRLTALLTGPQGVRVARLVRSGAGPGQAAMRLRPTRRGRALLRSRRRSTALKLSVTAKPRVGTPLTLRREVTVRP